MLKHVAGATCVFFSTGFLEQRLDYFRPPMGRLRRWLKKLNGLRSGRARTQKKTRLEAS
jgi:hypothetical protein